MQVVRKLTIATPAPELVEAYLAEIAKAYSVNWSPAPGVPDGDDGPHGGAKVGRLTFCYAILLTVAYLKFRN